MNRSGAFIALSTVSAVIAAGHAVVIKDNFSSNTLGTRWNVVDFTGPQAATTVAGGKLQVSGPGGTDNSYYALELQDCGFVPGSWKISVAVQQLVEPSAIASGEVVSACLGLQWGAFDPSLPVPGNINGYFYAVFMSNAGTVAATATWIDGSQQLVYFGNDSRARKFVGKMTATFTAKKDRLVLQAGRYKRTIPAFSATSPFSGSPEIAICGRTPGSVFGPACTFDDFSASGAGIVPWN
jgi:hypothetical protein